MMGIDQVRERRAVSLAAIAAVAFVALAVWGVVNLVDGDWFIGGLFVGCAIVSLPSLVATVRRLRHGERR